MDLKNKIVLVTGSSRGIGLAIAREFAKEGANIVLNARSNVSEQLISEMESYGVKCIAVSADISSYDDVTQMLTEIEKFGTIDVLVNNAGITKDTLLLRMKESDFEDVLKVNLGGTFNVSQQVFKKMMKQKSGVIINMSSVSAQLGNIGQANYAASKAGIDGFTRSLAREGASRNIRCNALAPGFIKTDMTEVLSDKVKEDVLENIPLNTFGNAEDVAKAAVFLAKNNYITGQVLNIDGGLVMNN
jgi:3-oxoacyl-(acyl-carrier-protein) reductase